MKKLILMLLVAVVSSGVWAQSEPQAGFEPEKLSDVSAALVYFFPSQQWSGFYDSMVGFEAQYRYWFSEPFGVAVAGGFMSAKVRKENPNLIEPSKGVFEDSARMVPLGLSALCRVFDVSGWGLNLEAGFRYVIVSSDVQLKYLPSGLKESVNMEDCWVGVFGVEVDRRLTEDISLFAGGGVQLDLSPGSMETKTMWLYDNNLKGYSCRLGARYAF